jgi:pilus assembly protein CpaC
VPTITGFTAAGLQGVEFIPFGVLVSFTPQITDKDRIRLNVAAVVSAPDQNLQANVGGTNVPGLQTRNFQTTVELREGQTLAVAGLMATTLNTNTDRVPLIGELPLVGQIARFDRTSAGEQELVLLITPELVHPMEPKEVPPIPGSDLFEPGDLEFYLLGRLESRRTYDYRSTVMNDLHRMKLYRHCEQIFIIGPHGHSDGQH